jgi:hypothetical protein
LRDLGELKVLRKGQWNRLWLLGLLSAVIYAVNLNVGNMLTWLGFVDVPPPKIVSHLILLLPLSLFYVLALLFLRHVKEENSKTLMLGILLFAFLFRLPLIPQTPVLSSDLYRYLWDGKVQVLGEINPYLYPPADQRLAFLRDKKIHPNINRREARTIYPAGAQLFFRAGYLLRLDTPAKFKAIALVAESLTLFLLILILSEVRLPHSRVLIYAWNPLVIYELFHSGHLESLMLPPLLAFVYFFVRSQPVRAGAALGLAAAVKIFPALLLVMIPSGKRLKTGIPFLLVVALAYLPYAGAGGNILGFLPTYFSDPYEIFNSGLVQSGLLWAIRAFSVPFLWTGYILFLLLIAILIKVARWSHQAPVGLIPKLYLSFSAYLLLIYPALHPWYLCSMIPFLCLTPSRAWLYLSLVIPLSYLKYLTPDGVMASWVIWVEFAPLYVLLATEHIQTRTLNERRSKWFLETPASSSATF